MYPRVKHDIESRLLPNITDGSLKTASNTNAVVKGLENTHVNCKKLEELFNANVGKVKCCKVSRSIDAEGEGFVSKSNGYGFVNFETKELLELAIDEWNERMLDGSKISMEKYDKELRKEQNLASYMQENLMKNSLMISINILLNSVSWKE